VRNLHIVQGRPRQLTTPFAEASPPGEQRGSERDPDGLEHE
jgi:hypothetical protein